MNEFNDFNDIIVFYLRKIKVFLAIIAIVAVGFAGVRTLGGYKDYQISKKTLQEHAKKENEVQKTTGEPLQKTVKVLINIKPIINESGKDMASYIVGAFLASQNNSEVTNLLLNEFLEAEKADNQANRELLYQYGYILDKERNYNYGENDFISQMSVSAFMDNYVSVNFTSMNEERARQVAAKYAELLIETVEEQTGKFEYELMEESIVYTLPSTSAGASPTRVISNNASTGEVVSFSTVIKEGIKGGIWGSILGFAFAVLIISSWYLTSKKIQKISDLNENVRLYGIYIGKQRKFRFWQKLIYNLEGEKRCFNDEKEITEIVAESLKGKKIEGSVMIAGSVESVKTQALYKAFETNEIINFECAKCVFTDVESIRKCRDYKQVILIEEIGKTIKKDVQRELDMYAGYFVEVLGVLLVE